MFALYINQNPINRLYSNVCILVRYWQFYRVSSLAFAFVRLVRHFIIDVFSYPAPCTFALTFPFIVFDLKFLWSHWGLLPSLHRLCLGGTVPRMSLAKHLLTETTFCSPPLVSLHNINLFQLISQSVLVHLGAGKHRLCCKSQPQEDLFTSNS